MGRIFSTGSIPKNIPTWQYNAFRQIAASLKDGTDGLAAISRNETPDGSGNPLVPPIDLSAFFKLAGRSPGQVAYGSTDPSGNLQLGSTFSSTKGFILFGATVASMAFDETNGRLGIGTLLPAARLHLVGSPLIKLEIPGVTVLCDTTNTSTTITGSGGAGFTPSGGPRIVPGMLITGTGIPANTFVEHLTNSTTLVMTQAASATGTVTLTFTTSVVVQTSQETETGDDIEWTTHGGLRITPGNAGTPFRFTGDKVVPATGAASSSRLYLEGGKITGGSSIGAHMQIGGPGHGELQLLDLLSRTFWFTRNPASGPTTCVAINQNPQEYSSSGPSNAVSLLVSQLPIMMIDGATIEMRGQTTGTSPSKVVGEKGWDVDSGYNVGWYTGNHDAEVRSFYIGRDSQNSGRGARECFRIVNQSEHPAGGSFANKNIFGVTPDRVWATSDVAPVYTSRLDFGDDKRGMLTGRGSAKLDRFGILSAFTTISDGTPTTIPLGTALLHLDLNSTTAQVGFLISAPGGSQTGDMMQVVSANAAAVTFTIDKDAFLNASLVSTSLLVDSTDKTKKQGFDASGIDTATTRTLTIPNQSGVNAVGLFALTTSDNVNNSTTETDISNAGGQGSLTINAAPTGRSIRVSAHGICGNLNNDTIRLRLKHGSTTILDTGAFTLGSATTSWEFSVILTWRSATTVIGGGVVTFQDTVNGVEYLMPFTTGNSAVTVSSTGAISLTAQWGGAGAPSASDTITTLNFNVETIF